MTSLGVNSFLDTRDQQEDKSLSLLISKCIDAEVVDPTQLSLFASLIRLFTKDGETVFDPFLSSLSTLIGCGVENRKFITFANEKYDQTLIQEISNRFQFNYFPEVFSPLETNELCFPFKSDFIITVPPKLMISDYGTFDDQYTNHLSKLEKVFFKCRKSLNSYRNMIVLSSNYKKENGDLVTFAFDICKILQKYFVLKDERIIISGCSHSYVFVVKQKSEISLDYQYFNHILSSFENELNVQYVTIGSFALFNTPYFSQVLDYDPPDVDIILKFDVNNIKKIANFLIKKEKFIVYSWQDIVNDSFDYDLLKGRYYFKGIKNIDGNDYIIDISYELDYIFNFDDVFKRCLIYDNIRVAYIDDICPGLLSRNNEKDQIILSRIRQLKKE